MSADETLREAIARLAEFLAQRETMRGLDPDHIAAANYAVLRASDLLAEHPATPAEGPNFEDLGGATVCWLNDDCIAGCDHAGPCRFPTWHTPEPAEVAVGEWESDVDALADAIDSVPEPIVWYDGHHVASLDMARTILTSDWLRDHDAALTAKAKAEGLREAAEALGEGDGISRFIGMDSMPEAVRAEKRAQQWLRERADREQP